MWRDKELTKNAFNWGLDLSLRDSPWPWREAWRWACRHGAGAVAENLNQLTHKRKASVRVKRANWERCGLLKLKSLSPMTHYQQTTPPRPSQTFLPTKTQHSNRWTYRACSHSTPECTVIVFRIREVFLCRGKMVWARRKDWLALSKPNTQVYLTLPCTFPTCSYYYFTCKKDRPTLRLIDNSEYSFEVFWGSFLESLHNFPYIYPFLQFSLTLPFWHY